MTTIDEPDRDAQVQALLERAARIRLAALGFGYPDAGLVGAVREAFARIGPQAAGLGDLAAAFEAARTAWSTAEEARLQLEFTRLFMGSAACPPHETSYGDARRIAGHGVELADIGGFYEAFGFTLSTGNPDLPDHLCTELEFYSLLLVKQAYARHTAEPEHGEIAADAARSFLDQHLGRWVKTFAEGLDEHGAVPPYATLGQLLVGLIQAECDRLGISPVLQEGRLPPDFTQADEFVCPMTEPPRTLGG